MPNTRNSKTDHDNERGGSHEQHVKAGEQSHSGTTQKPGSGSSPRGGDHERHVKSGEQSHKDR
jgi:hypothetical protein